MNVRLFASNSAVFAITVILSMVFCTPRASGQIVVSGSETITQEINTPLDFRLMIVFGPFGFSDETHLYDRGNNWHALIHFNEGGNNFGPDTLHIDGTLRHIIPPTEAPHGEGENLEGFSFTFDLDANRPAGSYDATAKTATISHGPHQDMFVTNVSPYVIDASKNFSSYTFTLSGHHTPEPGPFALLGSLLATGSACLLLKRRRRRSRDIGPRDS